jgi:hypothetical protein
MVLVEILRVFMRRAYKFNLTILICLGLLVSQFGIQTGRAAPTATIYHVSPTGSNTSTCGTVSQPCASIQKAVRLAASGDTILVATGTYSTPPSSQEIACFQWTKTVSLVCIVNEHLTIRGGYPPGNWDTPNPAAYPTVIDGANQYRGISVMGSSKTTATASLNLDGVTLQNCLAQGATSGTSWDLTASGGGIFIDKSNFSLSNVIFQNNKALGGNTSQSAGGTASGGGLTISDMPDHVTGTFENLTFINNEARGGSGSVRGGFSLGGGLYIWANTTSSAINGSYIIITNNLAKAGDTSGCGKESDGTVAEAAGGGLSIHQGIATFSHINVSYNQAIGGNGISFAGGGYGGGLELETSSTLNVIDSVVKGNQAVGGNAQTAAMAGGGGFLWDRTNVTLNRVQILSNTVRGGQGTTAQGSAGGGGIYATLRSGSSTGSILNSIIADNSLELASGSGNLGGGGGLWIQGYPVDIVHTTISNNHLDPQQFYGAALIAIGLYMPAPSNVTLAYSMITNHVDTNPNPAITQSALHAWTDDTINLNRSLFAGNSNDTNLENDPSNAGGPGTFNGMATMLYASSAGYVSAGLPFNNYHLRMDSAAKDQATTSTTPVDFEFETRPFASIADIGADEYHPFALTVSPVADGALYLNWAEDAFTAYPLLSGVDHYDILVTCPPNANPPQQGSCSVPFTAGQGTSITLTGLSPSVSYTVMIQAKDSSGSTLLFSIEVPATPLNFREVYIPLMLR